MVVVKKWISFLRRDQDPGRFSGSRTGAGATTVN